MNGELFFEKHGEAVDLSSPRRGSYVRSEEDGVAVLDGVCGDGTEYSTLIPSGREDALPAVLARRIAKAARAAGAENPRSILVAGLGNASVEADSLGPLTAERVAVGEVRPGVFVYALRPGVPEQSGIPTESLVRAAADLVGADLVVAVDSLAAVSPERIGAAVQVAGGIRPGGGTDPAAGKLGVSVPLVSVGVPTAARGTLTRRGGSADGLFTVCGIGSEVVFRAGQIASAIRFFAAE